MSIILDIVIDMNDAKLPTVGQLKAFLEGSAGRNDQIAQMLEKPRVEFTKPR